MMLIGIAKMIGGLACCALWVWVIEIVTGDCCQYCGSIWHHDYNCKLWPYR